MPSDPFIGQLGIFAFNQPPKGWALCNGQLLPINQNQALFSILGTTYGGDGRVNFALPDLRGRVPFHWGDAMTLGQRGGEQAHTLTLAEMPQHSHVVQGTSDAGTITSPSNTTAWAVTGNQVYAANPNISMRASAISQVGGSQPHDNMSPYTVLNICIALVGVFPSRN